MADREDYKSLINDIIAKEILVLGADIVLLKARNVAGLTLDSNGRVLQITGDCDQVLQKLIEEYIALSGQIVKNILIPVFAKYPNIKVTV